MTVTNNTQQALRVAQTPAALLALAQHIIDHQLPAPCSIETPVWSETGDLLVHVRQADSAAWRASIHVTDESAETRHSHSSLVRRFGIEKAWGTLPDTGIQIVVKNFHHQVAAS